MSADRFTDHIAIGVLKDMVPREVVDDVLTETGRREKRSRLLPAHVMVYFTMAMCLFFDDDYEEVIRKLVGTLRDLRSWKDEWRIPSTSAITQARARLGPEPLRELFARLAVPVAGRGTRGAWLAGRRLMAVDGVRLELPDTPENVERFKKFHAKAKETTYPKALIVGLVECGSHAFVDAQIGSCRESEKTLVKGILPTFEPGMLVLADALYYGYDLWKQAATTGADLLWKVGPKLRLPVLERLPDGSYISAVIDSNRVEGRYRDRAIDDLRAGRLSNLDQHHMKVRVVEYEVTDREGDELTCLITTLLDPEEISALELAAAYHERWEIELGFAEMKTRLRGGDRVLRSRSPDMAEQEIWAILLTHHAIRRLMCHAADEADIDADQLSFTRTVRIIRRHANSPAAFSPSAPGHGDP
ncbi:IS4 family transposase [Parafrankia discariae]|uniref:IS4 family transposase n=1 Tax=Parafrankia discariae TaxID=365528 RepID=UPI000685D043|nr:IS4 family transposase [Parafrankia discariae]